jgi:c-di-GMP-binding flagellar brake protein YcgR
MPRYIGPERRKFKRAVISFPVKYRLGPAGAIHTGHSIDISGGGICLGPLSLSNEWMLKNCEIELEISLPHSIEPIKAIADVVRVEGSKRPHHIHHRCRHNVRMRFCKISEQDRERLVKFVDKCLQ